MYLDWIEKHSGVKSDDIYSENDLNFNQKGHCDDSFNKFGSKLSDPDSKSKIVSNVLEKAVVVKDGKPVTPSRIMVSHKFPNSGYKLFRNVLETGALQNLTNHGLWFSKLDPNKNLNTLFCDRAYFFLFTCSFAPPNYSTSPVSAPRRPSAFYAARVADPVHSFSPIKIA